MTRAIALLAALGAVGVVAPQTAAGCGLAENATPDPATGRPLAVIAGPRAN